MLSEQSSASEQTSAGVSKLPRLADRLTHVRSKKRLRSQGGNELGVGGQLASRHVNTRLRGQGGSQLASGRSELASVNTRPRGQGGRELASGVGSEPGIMGSGGWGGGMCSCGVAPITSALGLKSHATGHHAMAHLLCISSIAVCNAILSAVGHPSYCPYVCFGAGFLGMV